MKSEVFCNFFHTFIFTISWFVCIHFTANGVMRWFCCTEFRVYDMANIERNVHHGKMAFPNGCFIGFWNLPKWKENGRKKKEMKWNGISIWVYNNISVFECIWMRKSERERAKIWFHVKLFLSLLPYFLQAISFSTFLFSSFSLFFLFFVLSLF